MPSISKQKRETCYKRDSYKCTKCGSGKNLTIDHVIPKTMKGGVWSLKNLQTLCFKCNNEKGRNIACYTKHKKTLKHLRLYTDAR